MHKNYPESYRKAEKIFRENNGILRASEAIDLGIHLTTLQRMADDGYLIKEARGLYRLADIQLGDPDLIQVSILIPKSVICLISALGFHDLTTQVPRKIYIALPRSVKAPRIEYPPIEVIHLSKEPYQTGIEEHKLDGVIIRIYDKEKTIADCFKFRNKIGLEVAIEALQDYLRSSDKNLSLLAKYSKIDRVKKVITPYINAQR